MNGTTLMPVLRPSSFGELVQFAKLAAESDLMPKDYKGKPANIMIAVQMGSELGLSPMSAIQNIAVINGRPSVWGDAMIGLCKASGLCQGVNEIIEGDGDARKATCVAKRRGNDPISVSFSVADAKKAGLWDKDIWAKYPDRMLQMRARGFALRDAFPDVLKGLVAAEEARDMVPEPFTGTTIQAEPERQLPAQRDQGQSSPDNGNGNGSPSQPTRLEPLTPFEPTYTVEQLRDRTDKVISALAMMDNLDRVGKAENQSRKLLADIDMTDGAADLKVMLLDAFVAARERVGEKEDTDTEQPAA